MPLSLADDLALRPEPDRILSAREFRAFQLDRPDRERWELIAGRPVMMTPVNIIHNRVADNVVRLLNDALETYEPARTASQRTGVELGPDDAFRPEPDFVVIDTAITLGQRFADRCYLLGEVVSDTDMRTVPATGRPWIEIKRDLYRGHAHCLAVIILEQERIEARVDRREPDGWHAEILSGPEGVLALPAFGLSCPLAALYKATPLVPR